MQMITEAIVNLSIVGLTCLLLLIYLIRFVLKYKHEYESNPLCTLTVVSCLLIVFIVTFVLPVDIFLVSFAKEPDGSFKSWATNETLATIDRAVFGTYYALYGIIVFLIFMVIPFLHFLNEISQSNVRDRLHNAIKNTFGFVVLMAFILTLGALINERNLDPNTIFNKIIHLAETTRAQNAMTMILTIITSLGFINVAFYTASGIFSWPIGLLLGTSSVADRVSFVTDRETLLTMRINGLLDKARLSPLTPREQDMLAEANSELSSIRRERVALSDYSDSWTYKLRKLIRPIQIINGVTFGLLAVFLVVTLIMVNIDRILHGAGPKQGYILLNPQIFNPLEYVYQKAQDLIFIGPMPLLIITCFLVVATISGIRNLGLWFLFARLHRIKVGRTQPQALLFLCITMMLAAMAFNLILYSMTSQYITFGSQQYQFRDANGTLFVRPCTLENYDPSSCLLTRSSVILMRMMTQISIFGAIFYWWTWIFILIATISAIGYLIRGRRDASHGLVSDVNEFED